MFEICIPLNINSNYSIYKLFTDFLNIEELLKNSEKKISLNFKNLKSMEGHLCAFLAAFIDEMEKKYELIFTYCPKELDIFLQRERFNSNFSDEKKFNYSDTIINFKEFKNESSDEDIGEYIYSQIEGISHLKQPLKDRIVESIFELFENAKTHGRCEIIYACSQFLPTTKKTRFSIVDIGYTIPKNVKTKVKFSQDHESITWASQLGNSTKEFIPGGAGLAFLESSVESLNGKIQIISGKGFYERTKSKKIVKELEHSFPGTIINIEFINCDSEFVLAETYESLEDIKYKLSSQKE